MPLESENSILDDVSFAEHDKHVRGNDFSCIVCHDPHGIPSSSGNSTNNYALIDFDRATVTPNSQGNLEYVHTGQFSGRCSLTCHGEDHINRAY